MEKMDNKKMTIDCDGVPVGCGEAVCVLTSGNFIYGHITEVMDNGDVKVIPDIGYNTTKPNFRLKKIYQASPDMIGKVNVPGDVLVDESNQEVTL